MPYNALWLCAGGASKHVSINPPLNLIKKNENMNIADNPHLHKTAVISRFSNYCPVEYSVTDVESGDRIKFIAGGFVVSIESSNAEEGFLICLRKCFGRDGISLIEKDSNKILDRIEDVLENGL